MLSYKNIVKKYEVEKEVCFRYFLVQHSTYWKIRNFYFSVGENNYLMKKIAIYVWRADLEILEWSSVRFWDYIPVLAVQEVMRSECLPIIPISRQDIYIQYLLVSSYLLSTADRVFSLYNTALFPRIYLTLPPILSHSPKYLPGSPLYLQILLTPSYFKYFTAASKYCSPLPSNTTPI